MEHLQLTTLIGLHKAFDRVGVIQTSSLIALNATDITRVSESITSGNDWSLTGPGTPTCELIDGSTDTIIALLSNDVIYSILMFHSNVLSAL